MHGRPAFTRAGRPLLSDFARTVCLNSFCWQCGSLRCSARRSRKRPLRWSKSARARKSINSTARPVMAAVARRGERIRPANVSARPARAVHHLGVARAKSNATLGRTLDARGDQRAMGLCGGRRALTPPYARLREEIVATLVKKSTFPARAGHKAQPVFRFSILNRTLPGDCTAASAHSHSGISLRRSFRAEACSNNWRCRRHAYTKRER